MEQWSSKFGFILAAIGAAVGLGNIWRFPAVVGQNGGGAYLIPYLIAAVAFAVPLMIMEISVGRSLKADIVTACRKVRREYEIIGWFIAGIVLIILSYYLVITGWVLGFFLSTAAGADLSFAAFTDTYQPLALFLISLTIVGAVVSLGVQQGIERMAKVLIPMTFIVLALLGLYSTTLAGFSEGLRFFLTPELSVLSDPLIWSAAFGQVFFSFSVGMGVLLTYGSYLGSETNVVRSSIIIAAADLAVAMIAGIVIFTIVFSFGLETTAGTELAFVTLPAGFEAMPFGWVAGTAFFGLLFVAAITPSVSMFEVGVASVMRTTAWSRRKTSAVMLGVILLAGLPSALSYTPLELSVFGHPILDGLDATVGTLGLPLAALGVIFVFTWAQEQDAFRAQLEHQILRTLVKYVVPLVLIVVTTLRLVADVDPVEWRRLPGVVPPPSEITVAVMILIGFALIAFGWSIRHWRITHPLKRR